MTERTWLGRRAHALRTVLVPVFFVILPVGITLEVLLAAARKDSFAIDFHYAFWPAGKDVLAGRSPFPPVTREALGTGVAYVYPPFAALVMAPFSLLPHTFADILFTSLLIVAAMATLYLLGVRDWRCFGVILLWPPIQAALQTANLSLLLALGLALLWHHRDRVWAAATIAAALVALKIFLWPVIVWLFASRRFKTSLLAVALGAGMTFGAWAVVGLSTLDDYVDSLRLLSKLEQADAYTPLAVALKAGLSLGVAHALNTALAAGVLASGLLLAWRTRGDARSLTLVLLASLFLSPIVWLHYFALCIVPLALLRPAYGSLWLIPLALWVCPIRPANPTWLAALVVCTISLMLALAMTPPRRPARSGSRALAP